MEEPGSEEGLARSEALVGSYPGLVKGVKTCGGSSKNLLESDWGWGRFGEKGPIDQVNPNEYTKKNECYGSRSVPRFFLVMRFVSL